MKNFQTEYNSEIENNLPDLWDRIEKGIDEAEKSASADKPAQTKFYNTRVFKICSRVAATAACLALVVILWNNVFSLQKSTTNEEPRVQSSSKSDSASESPAYDYRSKEPASIDIYSNSAADVLSEPDDVSEAADSEDASDGTANTVVLFDRTAEMSLTADGTYLLGSSEYLFCLELTGPMTGNYEGCLGSCTVLTNIDGLNFEDVLAAAFKTGDFVQGFDPADAVIISFELRYGTDE